MILLTGFEPFDGDAENPSQLVVERLAGCVDATAILPVSAARTPVALRAAIERHRPDVVLSLGLASERAHVSLERVAINVVDCVIADNDGVRLRDEPVLPGGPTAYFSTLPLRAILAAWEAEDVPGELSNSAGTFMCNQALYWSLHLAAEFGHRAGFIHVPPASEAGLPLDAMERAVRIALAAASTWRSGDAPAPHL